MVVKRKNGRAWLRETQPDAWKTAFEVARVLSGELTGPGWEERSFIFDQFFRDLVEELMGPDGLNDVALLPISDVMPKDDASVEEAGQLVASVRSILTAALIDLPDDEFNKLCDVSGPHQALFLLVSELDDHNEAARTYIASHDVAVVLKALKPLVGITVLMLADRAGGNTMEPLTSAKKLKASLDEVWGEELS